MNKKRYRTIWMICALIIISSTMLSYAQNVATPDGYATQNGGTTGGGDATPITISDGSAFRAAVEHDTPAVIIVDGKLYVGEVNMGANKTIIGADENSGLYGGVIKVREDNCIFQNLIIGPSGAGLDGMEISGATNIFVTKCSFYDGADGCLDIVREADFVTVSWCKFYYKNQTTHLNTLMIGNRDDRTSDIGKLHVTLHHNWFAEKCDQRMPRVRYGHVHIYNNYYNSVGNLYCIGTGVQCHIRVENTYFNNVGYPWRDYGGASDGGELGWTGLKFNNCNQPDYMPNTFPVFDLPYSYTADDVEEVELIVTNCAGNTFKTDCTDTTTIKPITYYDLVVFRFGQGTVSQVNGSYPKDTTLIFTAMPVEGWFFDHWSEGLSGSDNPASLTLISDTLVMAHFTEDLTHIDNIAAASVKIYPNPVRETLYIEFQDLSNAVKMVHLFDSAGRCVLSKEIKESRTALNIAGFEAGSYSIMVSNSNSDCITESITIF